MPVKTLGKSNYAFLLSEGEGSISRETVTIASGQNLSAGTVLGQITTGGKYTAHTVGASNGSQNAVAILCNATDASTGDTKAVIIARLAEVADIELTYETGITAPNKVLTIAALATQNIIVR